MVGTKKSILIIEDDIDTRESLVLLFSLEQFVVRLAENRERAIEVLAHGVPDVILLDWFMPGMTIEDFVVKVRALYPSANLILISASLNTQAKAKELGIEHCVRKPFDPVELMQTVESSMRTGNGKKNHRP